MIPIVSRIPSQVKLAPGAVLIVGTVGAGKTVAARAVQAAFAAAGQTVTIDDDTARFPAAGYAAAIDRDAASAADAAIVTVTGGFAYGRGEIGSLVSRAQVLLLLRDHVAPLFVAAAEAAGFRVDEQSVHCMPDLQGALLTRATPPQLVDLRPLVFRNAA